MQANRGRDTAPELAIRALLHRAGMRFRVDHKLPTNPRRRADIAFTRVGLFVFIDGCFWHGCPLHYVKPKTRSGFWAAKLAENRKRDAETSATLQSTGATVLRIWEHESPLVGAALVQERYWKLRKDA